MACNCRQDLESRIREELGDPLAKVRGVIGFSKAGCRFMPSVEILYRKKKRDDTFTTKQYSMELAYQYCPFCGKQLYEDADLTDKNNEDENNH